MITVLLGILKIIGIVLLCILALTAAILLLVLFVPVRYQIKGYRKEGDEVPVRAAVKITWLLHILNAAFRYPEEPFLKVRIFCFTFFSTRKKEVTAQKTEKKQEQEGKRDDAGKQRKEKEAAEEEAFTQNKSEKESEKKSEEQRKVEQREVEQRKTEQRKTEQRKAVKTESPDVYSTDPEPESGHTEDKEEEENPTALKFIRKLIAVLKNIKYTICRICDRIKEIIQNIRFYITIIQSDSFQRAFQVCRSEAFKLVKSILPGKITGNFLIGLREPSSTAQILSLQGILYPLIGNHISITPDFENSVFEGDFFIKGKVTAFRILKTAAKVYFNKDLRKVIRLFKKGGSINGRK